MPQQTAWFYHRSASHRQGGSAATGCLRAFQSAKQEFTTARLFLFEAMTANTAHSPTRAEASKHARLSELWGKRREGDSLRMTYALFDKIAFFLNHYLELGISENKVFFRSIRRKEIQNRPFVWLSKDLYDREFQEATEPDASYLEHKYCQIHEQWGAPFLI
ncbi:LA2681 family HEPN domain-containing protein [Agrobacterium leguminum]